jgi:hypothetical protein
VSSKPQQIDTIPISAKRAAVMHFGHPALVVVVMFTRVMSCTVSCCTSSALGGLALTVHCTNCLRCYVLETD